MMPQIRDMYDVSLRSLSALLTNVQAAAQERAESLTT